MNMATTGYRYEPDYAVPPGWVLEEWLEVTDMSQAEFARRCGMSPKMISDVILGKAAIQPKTAIQFEKVLGVDARIWLDIDSKYQSHRKCEKESRHAAELDDWMKGFPVGELVKRRAIPKPESLEDRDSFLLSFFGVALKRELVNRCENPAVAYRHSESFESDDRVLATWLRLGEIEAEQIECADYDAARFGEALHRIRRLTSKPTLETLETTRRLCQESGVALATVKPLPKTALSGVSRWVSPRKALIQLSARHMSDDHLWFSFFHEAGHILLHDKRNAFIHDGKGKITKFDEEADKWATDFLIPPDSWEEFISWSGSDKHSVLDFAEEQGIAPGIVVGRLQHEGLLPWNYLNDLKSPLWWHT